MNMVEELTKKHLDLTIKLGGKLWGTVQIVQDAEVLKIIDDIRFEMERIGGKMSNDNRHNKNQKEDDEDDDDDDDIKMDGSRNN